MKKVFALLALMLFATPAMADLTRYEAVDILTKGTAVGQRWSTKLCTVWKYADRQFATAKHCSGTFNSRTQIKQSHNYDYVYVQSITIPVDDDKEGSKREDWMTFRTKDTMDEMVALPLGCGDEMKIGEQVAVGHYPAGLNFSVSFGHIMTFDITSGRNNAVIAIDAHAAPGSSGSPVISMETGNVIGILIEGIVSRFGAFAVGLENINNTDMCEGWDKEEGEGTREIIHDFSDE